MVSCFLNKKAVSILELVAAMAIVVCVVSVIIPNNVERIQNAQFKKTVDEMEAICQASMDYYISQGFCPTGLSQLAPTFMPQAPVSSPFNSHYQLSCTGNFVSVSDLIPAGLAQKNPQGPLLQVTTSGRQDNITITQSVPYSFIGRLFYDKKYLYGES